MIKVPNHEWENGVGMRNITDIIIVPFVAIATWFSDLSLIVQIATSIAALVLIVVRIAISITELKLKRKKLEDEKKL